MPMFFFISGYLFKEKNVSRGCGHIFGLKNSAELTDIIRDWLSDLKTVEAEGIKARDVVLKEYGFEAYWRALIGQFN